MMMKMILEKKYRKTLIMLVSLLLICAVLIPFQIVGTRTNNKIIKNETLENWTEDIQLTDCNIWWEAGEGNNPQVTVNSNNIIHVVYQTSWGTFPYWNYELGYTRSTDYGKTWCSPINLTSEDGHSSLFSDIAVNGQSLYVVWQDGRDDPNSDEIYFKHSNDSGQTWSNDTALTTNDGKASQWPCITVWNNMIDVVWSDWRNPDPDGFSQIDAYYRKGILEDNGSITWENEKRLTNNTLCDEAPHGLFVINNTLHILLTEYVGYWRVGYMKSDNGGDNWSDIKVLNEIAHSYAISIVGNSTTLHALIYETKLYSGDESAGRLVYFRSNDSGNSWENKKQLTYNLMPYQYYPQQIIMDPNDNYRLYITAFLHSDPNYGGTGEKWAQYFMSNDGGTTWQGPYNLSDEQSYSPQFAVSNGCLHAVFVSERTGNSEIYYKHYPKFNDPPVINYFYPLENLTITENQNITFIVNASDLDTDTLSYQWYVNSTLVSENTTSYTFYANATCSGIFKIMVVVSDNVSSPVNHTWTVIVVNVGELYDSISGLQDQINQLNIIISELNETINNLTQTLTLIWNELNQSIQDYSDLQNQTLSLMDTLSEIWDLLNQSKMNETALQSIIFNLISAQSQISVLWDLWNMSKMNEIELQNLLNISKQNETNLLSQIDILEDENEKLRNKLNETKTETPWVGIVETVIILVGICVIMIMVRKRKTKK